MPVATDKKQISIHIHHDLSDRMEKFCKEHGYKKTDFVEIAIKNELIKRGMDEKDSNT